MCVCVCVVMREGKCVYGICGRNHREKQYCADRMSNLGQYIYQYTNFIWIAGMWSGNQAMSLVSHAVGKIEKHRKTSASYCV